MSNHAKVLAEYFAVVVDLAKEYGNDVPINIIRANHPELNFMNDDEIDVILRHAEKYRNRLTSR